MRIFYFLLGLPFFILGCFGIWSFFVSLFSGNMTIDMFTGCLVICGITLFIAFVMFSGAFSKKDKKNKQKTLLNEEDDNSIFTESKQQAIRTPE